MLSLETKTSKLLVATAVAFGILTLGACSGSGVISQGLSPGLTQPAQQSRTAFVAFSAAGSAIQLPSLVGYSETITLPANNAPAGTSLSLTISTKLPAGTPAIPPDFLLTQPFLFFTLSSPKTVTLQAFPAFSLTLPTGLHWNGGSLHLAYYDPASGWKHIGNPTITGSTLTFAGNHSPITLQANVKYVALPFACTTAAIFVTNFNNSTITVYDEEGNQQFPTGNFPNLNQDNGITLDSHNGYLYVTNGFHDTVTVYDQEGNQIVTTGSFPGVNCSRAIAFDSNNHQLYVTNSFNSCATETQFSVTVYDEQGNQIATSGSFPNLNGLRGIAFDSNNHHLYIPNYNNNTVTVYDEQGNQIATTGSFPNLSFPDGIAVDSNNHHLYVVNASNNTMTVYDEQGNQVATTGSFPNLNIPIRDTFDSVNHDLYVANQGTGAVTVYDEQGNQIATTGSFPNVDLPVGLVAVPH